MVFVRQLKRSLLVLLLALHALAGEPPLLPLHSEYSGEENGLSKAMEYQKVKYFHTADEKNKYLFHITNGKLFTADQNLLNTLDGTFTYDDGTQLENYAKAIVVMDENNQLYFHKNPEVYSIHHSSLAAGKSVKFAGEIKVKNGILVAVTDGSGHYTPSLRHTHTFLKHLEQSGVDLSTVQVRTYEGVIQDFFNRNPTMEEIHDFVHFSLEDALVQASKERNPIWLLRYKPSIKRVLEKNPKELVRLFEQLSGNHLSFEVQNMLLPLVERHQKLLFASPKRLGNFARNFTPKNVGETLFESTKVLLKKAEQLGFSSLSPAELKQVAITSLSAKTVDPYIGKRLDEKIIKISKGMINPINLEEFYTMLSTNKTYSFDEITEQWKSSHQLQGSTQACDIQSLLKNVFIKN
jgi:hypothetical protein